MTCTTRIRPVVLREAIPRTLRFEALQIADAEAVANAAAKTLIKRFPESLDPGSTLLHELPEHGGRHLEHIDRAVAAHDPKLLSDYLDWVTSYLVSRGLPKRCLRAHLDILLELIADDQREDVLREARALVGFAELDRAPSVPDSGYPRSEDMVDAGDTLLAALLRGDPEDSVAVVRASVEGGMKMLDVYLGVVQPVMHAVGTLWQENDITVAQQHTATATLPSVLAYCQQALSSTAPAKQGNIALTCVEGELHETGLLVLTDLLVANGWSVRNMGPNNPADVIVGTLRNDQPDMIGISVTMTNNLSTAEDLIRSVQAEPTLGHLPVVVGGAAFQRSTQAWERIGADLYASSAQELMDLLADQRLRAD